MLLHYNMLHNYTTNYPQCIMSIFSNYCLNVKNCDYANIMTLVDYIYIWIINCESNLNDNLKKSSI